MTLHWPLPGVIPVMPPPQGRFRARRKHDIHSGIDLYCPDGADVAAMEGGTVVAVGAFTGPEASSPWWADTSYVMVEGPSGCILYGEVQPLVKVGNTLDPRSPVGTVKRVLLKDKGLPVSMLHCELYTRGTRVCCELWEHESFEPEGLLDPEPLFTMFLGAL